LTSLILDEERLRSERSDRKLWKTRVTGIDEYAPQAISGPAQPRRRQTDHQDRHNQEDADLRQALEESRLDAERDARKQRQAQDNEELDPELRKAIQLSQEEADQRRRDLEEQNAVSLFDDTPEPAPAQTQPTGYNQGYQQQPAVDWFGNPLQQQPQSTGFLNNQYAQPQQTGYQNGFPNGFQQAQPQPTGYDQFGQQPFLQQQNTIQPQQTAFQTNNPYGVQPTQDLFGMQSPQQTALQAGNNNPWASQPQAADALRPLPTGSNNPFAQKTQQAPSPSPFARSSTQPSLGTLYESQPTNQFSQPSQPNPIANYSAPQPTFQQPQKPVNPQHARLNALLASGEGQDTFGNTGDLRIPAQHTAPGTFVNSAGQGLDRLRSAQTGTNPFFSSQATGYQVPAQTGPANGYGGGFGQQQSNPFGARPVAQQGGSLIDL
jgi:epsin